MRGCSLVKHMSDVSVVFKAPDEVNEVSGVVFASHPRGAEHDGDGCVHLVCRQGHKTH